MGFISTSFSALSKLAAVGILLLAFGVGLAGVVYMSLSGDEIKVPEIVGKDFVESEKELAALGLKIRRRADRASIERINTVIEQLPRPGETVKTGQWISVVVSKAGLTADETPKSLIKDLEEDDSEKIQEMITDKPKKSRASSNSNSSKKKADTTRDTIANTAEGGPDKTAEKTGPATDNANKKEADSDKPKSPAGSGPKPQQSPAVKPNGDQRPRTTKP